jgi:NitT/TauT family transport system permease protein
MSADTVLPVAPAPAATPGRRRVRVDWAVVAVRVAVVVVILAIWQFAAGGPKSFLPAIVVSHPDAVARMMWHLLINGQLLSALGSTGLSVLYSMVIGAVIGVGLALATAVPVGRWLLEPLVTVTYAIPKVGLIPLYIILLGLNTKAHVALVTSAVLFAFYYAMRQAVDDIDRDRLVTLRLMGAGHLKVVTGLYLRSAMPQLLAALRISLPLAFATEIFAELQVPTTSGLGVLMEKFSQTGLDTLDASGAIAVMLFVVLVAYVLDVVIGGRLRRYTEGIGVGEKR